MKLDVRRFFPVDDAHEIRWQRCDGPAAVQIGVGLAASGEEDPVGAVLRDNAPARGHEFIDPGVHALVAGTEVEFAVQAEFGGTVRNCERGEQGNQGYQQRSDRHGGARLAVMENTSDRIRGEEFPESL